MHKKGQQIHRKFPIKAKNHRLQFNLKNPHDKIKLKLLRNNPISIKKLNPYL